MTSIQSLIGKINPSLGLSEQIQQNILFSLIVIFIFVIVNKILQHFIFHRISNSKSKYLWRKSISYTLFLFTLVLISRLWFKGIDSLTTLIGLISAGIAVAMKDVLIGIVGWAFILLRRPFVLGDRIEISEITGDVIDIRPFVFTVMEIGNWVKAEQSTGRIVHIPNGVIFTHSLFNYSQGFSYIWDELPVLITFESDWKKAKQILSELADSYHERSDVKAEEKIKEASRKYLLYYSSLRPKVYTSVSDSGVLLTVRYLSEPRMRRNNQELLWEEILTHFEACESIDFAYPTWRIYKHD